MLQAGKAMKVSIYLSEGAKQKSVPISANILDFLYFQGVSGATMIKGVAGFGADRHLHSSSLVAISDRLPIKIEFIETAQKVEELLPRLQEMAGSGMIELQETMIAKPAELSKSVKAPLPRHLRLEGKARMMQIYIGESDKWRDEPLHEALVRAMRANDLAGVTVYRAILGYGAHRRVHKEKPFHLSRDLSIVLSVIDTDEKLRAFLPMVEEMVGEGLVVFSDADVIKYTSRKEEDSREEESARGEAHNPR